MPADHKRLGDVLLQADVLTPEQLADAIREQRKTGDLLGATLIRLGLVPEPVLMRHLQSQLGLPLVDLEERVVDEQALALIKEELARKYLAIPLEHEGRSTLIVAMADPMNIAALEDLRFHSGMFIRPVLASHSGIHQAIERYYHLDTSMDELIRNIVRSDDEVQIQAAREDEQVQAIDELIQAEGRPIARLANWLLKRAIEDRATDIHIEPRERDMVVRLRIDGLLHEIQRLPKWTQGAVVSRIKALAELDVAEKHHPQNGCMAAEIRDRRVDLRVSTLPTTYGEKVVVRVADQTSASLDVSELGLFADDLSNLKRFLDRPQGILLVTGPTGSGKSTLLYSALRYLQHEAKNIVTVEDPVEVRIAGINQVQLDEQAKKSFPAALRAILRQDPDVIMIGEIRDRETAQIAFRASVTGHLVVSTLHTHDAAAAVTRLVDLGLEPFMVATSLIGVVSTRLVRTLCPKCREAYEVNASNLGRLGASESVEGTVVLHRGRGCPVCLQTGYHGRVGTFEVLEVTDTVRSLINQRAPDSAIRHAAIETGMRSIGEDGLRKVLDGLTTLEEVTRVVYLSEQAPKTCPTCRTVLAQDFEYCTSCGGFVGDHCEGCRRPLSAEWAFCPHCGSTTSGLARARASRSASRRQTATIDQGLERVPSRARRAS